jgi:hypothetical protein
MGIAFVKSTLMSTVLFEAVGMELTKDFTCFQLLPIRTWQDAVDKRGSNAGSNAFMEGRALQTRILGIEHKREYRKWNDHIADVHEAFHDEVFPKIDASIDAIDALSDEQDRVFLKHIVHWDVIAAAMEFVYADLVPPRFYAEILKIYAAGHFPCHWDEKWPDGKLWVY